MKIWEIKNLQLANVHCFFVQIVKNYKKLWNNWADQIVEGPEMTVKEKKRWNIINEIR